MVLFAKLSVWIGGPIVAAVFVGKWLDGKYGTAPWIFLATVAFAFILSSIGIVREAKGMMNDIIEKEKNKNTGDKK